MPVRNCNMLKCQTHICAKSKKAKKTNTAEVTNVQAILPNQVVEMFGNVNKWPKVLGWKQCFFSLCSGSHYKKKISLLSSISDGVVTALYSFFAAVKNWNNKLLGANSQLPQCFLLLVIFQGKKTDSIFHTFPFGRANSNKLFHVATCWELVRSQSWEMLTPGVCEAVNSISAVFTHLLWLVLTGGAKLDWHQITAHDCNNSLLFWK